MKKFSDFNIEITHSSFTGDKVKISKILNKEITVIDFKLGPSQHFKNDCLTLQIEVNGNKNVCFSGSTKLIEQIQKVPKEGFPFKTIIEEDNDMYLFT